jgi:hypothetical protein
MMHLYIYINNEYQYYKIDKSEGVQCISALGSILFFVVLKAYLV